MEISQETREQIQALVKAVTEAWRKIRECIVKFFKDNWEHLKEAAVKWCQLQEEKPVVIRQYHKRNFSRQKFSHQVIDRKPHHMVRKIIR